MRVKPSTYKTNKLLLRIAYVMRHLIALGLVAFGLTCLITSYELIPGKKEVDAFLASACIFIGICITIIAIFNRVEIEYFYRNNKSKKNV